jgi:membrane protease YdiL (CAAX protease family)
MTILIKPKRLKQFFVKKVRLWPILRVGSYLAVMAIAIFGVRPISKRLVVTLGMSWNTPFDMMITVALVLFGTWVCRRFIDKRDMSGLGFGLYKGWLGDISIGLLLGATLTGIVFLIELSLGWIEVTGFAWTTRSFDSFVIRLSVAAANMLAVAVMEETICRGYMLQTLEKAIGTPAAVFVSSAFFGVVHLMNPSAKGWADYVLVFTITLAGIMLAMAYYLRRSLWLPIALHFAWNMCEYYIFGLTGVPAAYARFMSTEVTGPTLWVGMPYSAFGPEVGMLGVITIFLGIGVIWIMKRHYMNRMPPNHSMQETP